MALVNFSCFFCLIYIDMYVGLLELLGLLGLLGLFRVIRVIRVTALVNFSCFFCLVYIGMLSIWEMDEKQIREEIRRQRE